MQGRPLERQAEAATSSSSVYTLRRLVLDEFAQPAPVPRQFDAPALIVRGACDFLLDAVARRYAEAFPNAILVRIPGAGHSLLDHEAEFAQAAASFAQERLSALP